MNAEEVQSSGILLHVRENFCPRANPFFVSRQITPVSTGDNMLDYIVPSKHSAGVTAWEHLIAENAR